MIFDYVYGVLHTRRVIENRFANNLSKELPRIPFAPDFYAFAEAGEGSCGPPPRLLRRASSIRFPSYLLRRRGTATASFSVDGEGNAFRERQNNPHHQ